MSSGGAQQGVRDRTPPSLPDVARRWLSVVVVGVAALVVTLNPAYGTFPDIRSDGLGYHAWIPALLRADFNFCGDAGLVLTQSTPPVADAAGHCPNKYPPGLALLELPVMAPLSLANDRSLVPGHAEDLASRWLGFAALVGLCAVLVTTCKRLRVENWATHVAVIALVFGTGLFHYGTYDNPYVHIYVAFLIAVLTYLGICAAIEKRAPNPLAVFALSFLIVETREVSAISLFCLAALWSGVTRSRRDASRPIRPDRTLAVGAAGVVTAVVVETAYASYARGALAVAAYGNETIDPRQLNEIHVLTAYDHGLFSWYPIVAVVLVGTLACPSTRRAAAVWAAGIAASVLLYGSWVNWRLGGGFGHRGFLDLMPGAAVLFALFLNAASPRWRTVGLLAVPVSVAVTFELMAGYWNRTIPFAFTTTHQYWSHVAGPLLLVVLSTTTACAIGLQRALATPRSTATDWRTQDTSA